MIYLILNFHKKKTTAFLLRNNGEYIISRVSDIHYKNNTNFPVINLVSLNKNIIHGDSGTIILDQNKKKLLAYNFHVVYQIRKYII